MFICAHNTNTNIKQGNEGKTSEPIKQPFIFALIAARADSGMLTGKAQFTLALRI